MYVLYKSKNILTLVTIGYIVGFIVGMYIEYCLWAQVAVLNHKLLYWTVWDMFMQILYLGRAPRTKKTLPDFHEKCRVTRHSRVFRGLTESQRTPGIWGVTKPHIQKFVDGKYLVPDHKPIVMGRIHDNLWALCESVLRHVR